MMPSSSSSPTGSQIVADKCDVFGLADGEAGFVVEQIDWGRLGAFDL